ncbi:MAG: DinB family protein [Acidobacteriota bacterium]|nr:DinB family protein [Acidobacteriota bacterium]
MPQPVLSAEELLAWVDRTASGWRELLTRHPEVLELPCDVNGVSTAGGLLQHIVAAQLRYAERLGRLPVTDYSEIPFDSPEAIDSTHRRSVEMLRQQLAGEIDWTERMEFDTRSGTGRSSRRTILFHALFHSIRHYAQLATLVRQHGIQPLWPMDYLFMDLEEV